MKRQHISSNFPRDMLHRFIILIFISIIGIIILSHSVPYPSTEALAQLSASDQSSSESGMDSHLQDSTSLSENTMTNPIAIIDVNNDSSTIDSPIHFSARRSYDPDGSIVSYEWNFGDGESFIGPETTHAYSNVGTYTITLTVTDTDGLLGQSSKEITVLLTSLPPTSVFPSLATAGLAASAAAAAGALFVIRHRSMKRSMRRSPPDTSEKVVRREETKKPPAPADKLVNYSRFGNYCPRCGSASMTYNAAGEMFCGNCGFVVSKRTEELGPEWRAFSKEEHEDRSRADRPISLGVDGIKSRDRLITKPLAMEKPRSVNVWINDHKSTDPLLVNKTYNFMINFGKKIAYALTSQEAKQLEELSWSYDNVGVTVALIGESFDIPTPIKELIIPRKGSSETISFTLIPKTEGTHTLEIFFYYKANLLHAISVKLEIQSHYVPSPTAHGEIAMLEAFVTGSSSKGLESIFGMAEGE